MPVSLRRLVAEYRDSGGDAIEVLSPSHTAKEVSKFAAIARTHGLKASQGSDWHGPDESAVQLGDLPPLPVGLTPVWSGW